MPLRDEIVKQALTLSPADRAYVVDVLDKSLVDEGFATPEIARAWVEEIERRIEAHDQGKSRSIDIDTALARMRQALDARREQDRS